MSYYKKEVVIELKVGEKYTGRQLAIFVTNRPEVIVISESLGDFNFYDNRLYEVKQKFAGYLHYGENNMYHQPFEQNIIYIIE